MHWRNFWSRDTYAGLIRRRVYSVLNCGLIKLEDRASPISVWLVPSTGGIIGTGTI